MERKRKIAPRMPYEPNEIRSCIYWRDRDREEKKTVRARERETFRVKKMHKTSC